MTSSNGGIHVESTPPSAPPSAPTTPDTSINGPPSPRELARAAAGARVAPISAWEQQKTAPHVC